MSWYVYMLRCADNSLYTGYTDDVQRRLQMHNSGKGAKYTRSRLPVKLVHREEYADKSDALKRECAIKRLSKTQKEALVGVEQNLDEISRIATQTLVKKGFSYGARAEIKREKFPTRVYEGYTLPAGEYTALILYLGKGEGDNWWCVVYPPLCFASAEGNPVYKSKIAEIIKNFRAKKD